MFYSILFPTKEQHDRQVVNDMPSCFVDLNLNQIVDMVLKPKQKFELDNIFFNPLSDRDVIKYRQDVFRDLENETLRYALDSFSKNVHGIYRKLHDIRRNLSSSEPSLNNYYTRGMLFDSIWSYCNEVVLLQETLTSQTVTSKGLHDFSVYLKEYCSSPSFCDLSMSSKKLHEAFSEINYCLVIKNNTMEIHIDEGYKGISDPIVACFEKFRNEDAKDYRQEISEETLAPHIEVATLQLLAKQYKPLFNELEVFCGRYFHFEDRTLALFSREIQFFLSWLDYTDTVKAKGLPFCYPTFSDRIDGVYCTSNYDLALSYITKGDIVTNDFSFNSLEQIIVLTGPNQGGKTTYARAFGQTHYLASLGLFVPGKEAKVFMFDKIFTHFGKGEDLSDQEGKLKDDLIRLRKIFDEATKNSIIIVNEIFNSTIINDALILGKFMVETLISLGSPALVITFLDELAVHSPETVSMMSTVLEDDPSTRTFKIVRKPPDGLAFAIHIAQKYDLTYEQLSRRLKNEV